jgi:flagellar FliL protein
MSDAENGQTKPPKKGKGLIVKTLLGVVLIGAGAGGTFGLLQAGMLGNKHSEAKVDNTPRLLRKGETDPYAPPVSDKEGGEASLDVPGDGGNKYRTAYYTFAEEFTSNLKGSAGLIQVSLAASTHRDGRVLIWLKKHELAVRSRILIELADTPEEDLLSPDGKERLQKRLTAAINDVLTQAEGFGGIDSVYFKSLLVQ